MADGFGSRYSGGTTTPAAPSASGGFGARYSGAASTPAATAPSGGFGARFAGTSGSSKPSGGVLGFVHDVGNVIGGGAHWSAGKLDLAAHDIAGIPGGLYAFTKPAREDAKATYDLATGNTKAANQALDSAHSSGKQLLHGTVESTKQVVEHPLRDPFQTLLTVAPVVDVAGRVADAGITASRAGDLAAGARRLAPHAPVEPRIVTAGDLQVGLKPSRNAGIRLVQKGYDHVIQRALDTNPEGRLAAHANRRVEGQILETTRRTDAMRQAQPALIQRLAGGHRINSKALGLPRPIAEAALRLTTINRPAALARDFHLVAAAKGGADAADHAKWATTFGAVEKSGALTTDAAGNTIVDAAKFPKLAELDKEIARGQQQVDEIAVKHGLATPEQLKAGRDNPGRVYSGAKYENPTPGKLGIPSQALLKARSDVARLQALHDRASTQAGLAAAAKAGPKDAVIGTKIVGPGTERLSTAPAAVAESEMRLAQLEREHNAALDKIGKGLFGPADRREVNYRTRQNKKAARQAAGTTGASGVKAVTRKTVSAERRALAEKAVEEHIAKAPDSPAAVAWRARSDEIDKLQALVNPDIFDKLQALVNPDIFEAKRGIKSGPGRVVNANGSARADKLGAALSVAKDKLETLEVQHVARQKPTGFVGGAAGREGRGYTTYATREPKAPKSPMAGARGPVVGRIKNPLNRKTFTGAGIEHGLIPDNVSRLNADHLRSMLRYVTGSEFRDDVAKTGSATRRSSRDILIRLPDGPAVSKLPAEIEDILGKTHSTVGETDAHAAAVQAGLRPWIESLIPGVRNGFKTDRAMAIGEEAPKGYKWVDRNLVRSLEHAATGPRFPKVARGVDTVNSAVTAMTVYFKVGHLLTRSLTNAVANVIQGSALPDEVTRSIKLWNDLTVRDRIRALAASGGHGIQALPHEGQNFVGRGASWGASQWARRIDAPFRFNSIAYEARKAGFKTPDQFRELLDALENPNDHGPLTAAGRAKVEWVAKRANREAIRYDGLNDFERSVIARGFWFYPWTKAAVAFAGNTLLEHPFKAAVLGAAGVLGRKTQAEQLGPVPSYEQGLIPLGGNRTTDFSTFSPFATAGQIAELGARPGGLAGMLNPAYGAALTAGTGVNQYGEKTKTPLGDAASQLFSPTPEAQILSAYLHPSKPTRMFHTTPLSALLRSLVGPALPRRVNLAALTSSAAREKSGR